MVWEFTDLKSRVGLYLDQIRQINWERIAQATKRQKRRLENYLLLNWKPMKGLEIIRDSFISSHFDN
jgi:hypothetical protein